MTDEPCMIARLGATELMTMVNYLGVHTKERRNILKYIGGQRLDWWWNKNCLNQMQQWSGFFPPTVEKIEQFCELMMEDMKEVDILGSWLANERYFEDKLKNIICVDLEKLNPFFVKKPWTQALQGKNVVVIHPFAKSLMSQYQNKDKLFANEFLPAFNLHVIPAIQSIGGERNGFDNWFQALDYMKNELDKINYDICLIGCGAYGFPIAAYVKRQGKKAIHLGGVLQLYFGIKGKRWELPRYKGSQNDYSTLFNDYWVRPLEEEKPKAANNVESACYW
jgi:hypothetical protein